MQTIMNTHVMTEADYEKLPMDWGKLTWFVSNKLGNSDALTVGRCEIKPGCANPRHSHPNCAEVLHVVQGRVLHSIAGSDEVEMNPGDTISIPSHCVHNARNIGSEMAVMLICFSSARRETKGE